MSPTTTMSVPDNTASASASAAKPLAQHLSPTSMEPLMTSRAAVPLSFLEKIHRVEINRKVERQGVTFYVLDVFLEHHSTRIPTNKTAETTRKDAAADYQVERRFNDFANLRYQVWAYAQRQHADTCGCKYCDAYMTFIVHSMSQPRLLVKLATGVNQRKRLLQTFCNAFLGMAVGGKTAPRPRDLNCDGYRAIPYVVERFLRKEQPTA